MSTCGDAKTARDVRIHDMFIHREGLTRAHPHHVDAEVPDIVQLLDDAPDVAPAVAIAVLERRRVDLVDGRFLPPGALGRGPGAAVYRCDGHRVVSLACVKQ